MSYALSGTFYGIEKSSLVVEIWIGKVAWFSRLSGKCIGKYIGNICKKCIFFNLPKFCQPQPFKLETPYLDQLLTLGLQKIALSPIFDICLDCQNFGNYCAIFANYCPIMIQIGPNLGK